MTSRNINATMESTVIITLKQYARNLARYTN